MGLSLLTEVFLPLSLAFNMYLPVCLVAGWWACAILLHHSQLSVAMGTSQGFGHTG